MNFENKRKTLPESAFFFNNLVENVLIFIVKCLPYLTLLVAASLIMLGKVRIARPDSFFLILHSWGYCWIVGMACTPTITAIMHLDGN